MSGFANFAPVAVTRVERNDGSVLLDNAIPLGSVAGTMPGYLRHWAQERPDGLFLSEATPTGRRLLRYDEAALAVRRLAARLMTLPLGAEQPLMMVAGNGIDHALMMLAATSVAISVAVVSPTYTAPGAAPWAKLDRLIDTIGPGLVVADDTAALASIFETLGRETPLHPLRDLGWIDAVEPAPGEQVDAAMASVGGDTIAKLLFTSGSTGSPKAVITTQAMMASNMAGLALVWPFLRASPPVLVDWLPWNHVFGGNCCFNVALAFGGTLHIDDGRPMPGHIERTVAAIREFRPTAYFNVPGGYDALLPHLEADHDLARRFLGGLDLLFNAGAAMPASIRDAIIRLSREVLGRVPPIVGGWGSTETAPFSTALYFDTDEAANLGVPLPGTTIKLAPAGGRMELRVRGPNVMPGYWRQPEATAAAFDEEGFYRIGDAGRLADAARPEAGIVFDGRIAENFKLNSGTWVNVGALRLALISALSPLVSDVVIAGEGRHEIGALLFLNPAEADADGRVAARLRDYNDRQLGSSTRVARFAVMAEPPSSAHDEITDKGYINQRAVLRRRAALVDVLFAGQST